jgi:hypothetical protein
MWCSSFDNHESICYSKITHLRLDIANLLLNIIISQVNLQVTHSHIFTRVDL